MDEHKPHNDMEESKDPAFDLAKAVSSHRAYVFRRVISILRKASYPREDVEKYARPIFDESQEIGIELFLQNNQKHAGASAQAGGDFISGE